MLLTKKKIKLGLSALRYLPWTIYFNFHYLPFWQAIHLPIILYKPKLLKCKGSIKIEADHIRTGMIRLGFYTVSLYPNTGIVWENHGGSIIFRGSCQIGNDVYISVGAKGKITFGNHFAASAGLKLVSYKRIDFLDSVRIGWDCIIMDTNFHKLTKLTGGYTRSTAPITIGANNWLGLGCLVLKGTRTPDFCVFGARSVLNKEYDFPLYSLCSGNPVELKTTGVYRNLNDDNVDY